MENAFRERNLKDGGKKREKNGYYQGGHCAQRDLQPRNEEVVEYIPITAL